MGTVSLCPCVPESCTAMSAEFAVNTPVIMTADSVGRYEARGEQFGSRNGYENGEIGDVVEFEGGD